jgi:hypothetical protein
MDANSKTSTVCAPFAIADSVPRSATAAVEVGLCRARPAGSSEPALNDD